MSEPPTKLCPKCCGTMVLADDRIVGDEIAHIWLCMDCDYWDPGPVAGDEDKDISRRPAVPSGGAEDAERKELIAKS